jgi:hypothetical protein
VAEDVVAASTDAGAAAEPASTDEV